MGERFDVQQLCLPKWMRVFTGADQVIQATSGVGAVEHFDQELELHGIVSNRARVRCQ